MDRRTLISLETAAERILARTALPAGREDVPLAGAPGRVLAQDLFAGVDLPPFHRSPLDGYALRSADLAGARPERPAFCSVTARAGLSTPPIEAWTCNCRATPTAA